MASNNGGRRGYPQASRNVPMKKKGGASSSWKCVGPGCPAWGHQSKSNCARCGAPKPRLGHHEQGNSSAASLAGSGAGNRAATDFGYQASNMRGRQTSVRPDSGARTGMNLPQMSAGLSVARASLIPLSPTPAAESTAEGSATRNKLREQDAEAVRAAAATAAVVTVEPTPADMRTLGGNPVRPVVSAEMGQVADGDTPDVSQLTVQTMIDSNRGNPAADEKRSSGAATASESPDAPGSPENDADVAGGGTTDTEEALPGQWQECVIPAVKNQSGGTGGGPAVGDTEVVLVGDVTGGGEPRNDESGENRDGAAAAAATATAAVAASAAPTLAGTPTLENNVVLPGAPAETEEALHGDAPGVSHPTMQDMTGSNRSTSGAEEQHPSGVPVPARPPDAPVPPEDDANVAGGGTESQEEALAGQGQVDVIPAVNNRSEGTGGRPVVADAQVVPLGGGGGGDEGRPNESGGNGDRARAGAQQEQQRSVCEAKGKDGVVHGVAAERPVVNRGRWWGPRILGAVVMVVLVVGGRALSGGGSSSTYRGDVLWQGDVVGVGQHLGSRGIFPWFGSLAVTEGGGLRAVRKIAGLFTYQEVSIADDVPEEERAKGFLCTAERFARRMTGRQDAEYGLSITNGQLVLGSGRFCREFTTPVSGGVADRLGVGKRGGGIRHAHGAFDVVGNFQAISSRGEVLWSTAGSAGKGGDSGGGDGGWWRFGAKGKSGAEGPEETNHGMGVAGGGEGRVDGGSWWRPGGNTGPHR